MQLYFTAQLVHFKVMHRLLITVNVHKDGISLLVYTQINLSHGLTCLSWAHTHDLSRARH